MGRVLELLAGSVCYDSTEYFLDCIAAELSGRNVECRKVRLDKDDFEAGLKEFYGEEFDCILTINTRVTCYDYLNKIKGPVYLYLLDHPLYHHDTLLSPLNDLHVICIDKEHVRYVKDNYSNIKDVRFIPLSVSPYPNYKPLSERKYGIVFSGSYTDPDLVRHQMDKISGKYGEGFNPFRVKGSKDNTREFLSGELYGMLTDGWLKIMLDNPSITQEEAMRQLLDSIDKDSSTDGADLPNLSKLSEISDLPELSDLSKLSRQLSSFTLRELLHDIFLADVYLHAMIRQEIILEFIRQKVDIELFGHDWDIFIYKYEIVTGEKAATVTCHDEVSYSEMPAVYADSKLVLNHLPLFRAGIHDRVPMALASGALVLTESNPYMDALRENASPLNLYETFSLEDMTDIPRKATEMLACAENVTMEEQAHRAAYINEHFSWKRWVDELDIKNP